MYRSLAHYSLIIFFLTASLTGLHAQKPAAAKAPAHKTGQAFIDSCIQQLPVMKEDTNKVNVLYKLAMRHLSIDMIEAEKYAGLTLQLSKKLNWKMGLAKGYFSSGVIKSANLDFQNATAYLDSAQAIYQTLNFKHGLADVKGAIGSIYKTQGKYKNAIEAYQQALQLFRETGDKYWSACILVRVGESYDLACNFKLALESLQKALDIYDSIGNKNEMTLVLAKMGRITDLSHDVNDTVARNAAIAYYQRALKIEEDIPGINYKDEIYLNIAELYQGIGEYKLIEENAGKVLEYAKQKNDKTYMGTSLMLLAYALKGQKKLPEALKMNGEALNILNGDKQNYLTTLMNQGSIYEDIYNDSTRKSQNILHLSNGMAFQNAVRCYKKVIPPFKEINDNISLQTVYKHLHNIYEKAGDYKNALKYSLLDDSVYHELYNDANSKAIAEMKEKYESEKKQDTIALLNKDKALQNLAIKKQKQTKNYLIAGFALVAVISLVGYSNYRTRQQLKLQTLRNKIARDLHDDVGSTLSSIAIFSQMAQEQSREVQPLLTTIEDSSRKMLDAMADIVWTINPENDQFEKIIQRMRSFAYELLGAKGMDFEFVADEEVGKTKLSMEARKNLYLIFKEATNNMVKYSGADKAMFTIKEDKKYLTLLIRDNGKGFDMSQPREGNGLKNMRKRAEEIGAMLTIDSTPGIGTSINLRLAI